MPHTSLYSSATQYRLWKTTFNLVLMIITACTLTPSPTLTEPPLPSPTFTVIPTIAITPTPESPWQFSGDYVTSGNTCKLEVPVQGFILGVDPNTCVPGTGGSSAVRLAPSPISSDTLILIIKITCPPPTGCANAVEAQESGGKVSIAVNDQTLWQASCDKLGACANSTALSESPVIAFITRKDVMEQKYEIKLTADPNMTWSVANVEFEWLKMPSTIQGIAYSPFRDCQNPGWGPFPQSDEILEDMLIAQHMGNAIRTYSSVDIQGQIPGLARKFGLRVSAGAWLGKDKEANEKEIEGLIKVAKTVELESVIVGNEVLLRGDLTEDELIAYIERVKSELRTADINTPVTTAEIGSVLVQHPRLTDVVDYYLVHIYAYWDGKPIENAARYVVDEYHKIQAQANSKRVIIGETGWPSAGPSNGEAVPSPENQRRFLREFLTLARLEDVEFYYFASFDELWKTGERGVGTFWGIMYADRSNKHDLQSVLIPLNDNLHRITDVTPRATGTPEPNTSASDVFPIYTTYAAVNSTNDPNETLYNHFIPSGWMGDTDAIHFNDCIQLGERWEDRSIEIQYIPSSTDAQGWAGIYWQEPENNWGNIKGGYDLSQYEFTELSFRARSAEGKARVQFFMGGILTGDYPSSVPKLVPQEADPQGFVTLTEEWTEFHIDLQGINLDHVIDGFGWVAVRSMTPNGVTVYLDDIIFDHRTPPPAPPLADFPIYTNSTLSAWFDMSVDTAGHLYDWVTNEGDHICMSYPPGQSWGVVYITVGQTASPGHRQALDFSMYQTLSIELRGKKGGEVIYIGIKDNQDPDSGRETKIPKTLTSEWETYKFSLSEFATADLSNVYIPVEFVFEPSVKPETVCFRNVWYLLP